MINASTICTHIDIVLLAYSSPEKRVPTLMVNLKWPVLPKILAKVRALHAVGHYRVGMEEHIHYHIPGLNNTFGYTQFDTIGPHVVKYAGIVLPFPDTQLDILNPLASITA